MAGKATIVFGGGCFWCTEAVFKMLNGVLSVEPGYAGADTPNGGPKPTYEEISTGTTGYAEVVKIEYDPSIIKLETLLTVFFASHDPTTKDRQGNDVGTQYRSIILLRQSEASAKEGATGKSQMEICQDFIEKLNNSSQFGNPVVTQVEKLDIFYPAEDYHKNYYENNKGQFYCQVVINPKLEKVQKEFAQLLKK